VADFAEGAAQLACTVLGLLCADAPPSDGPVPSRLPPDYFKVERPADPKPAPAPKPVPARLEVVNRIAFGSMEVGRRKLENLLLRNSGGATLGLRYVELSGSNAFTVSSKCPDIPVNQACRVQVSFAPFSSGPVRGTILVGWESSVSRVELEGVGVAKPQPAPVRPKVVKRAPKAPPPPPPVDFAREAAFARTASALNAELAASVVVHKRKRISFKADGSLPDQERRDWRFSDKDYNGARDGVSFKGDESGYPVERCRILSGDDFIPLVLAHTINSQISGPVLAHVDRDVHSVDGRLVLIPRGTKFRGVFQPLEKQGDTRLTAQWTRLTRPDGASVALTETGVADAQGRSGMSGETDNRFFEKYGTVIGATLISGGIAFAAQESADADEGEGALSAAGESVTQSLGQVTAEALREAANLAPRVTVPKGTLLFANPGRDWYFPNAYQVVALKGRPANLSFNCSGEFFRDDRGIAQNERSR